MSGNKDNGFSEMGSPHPSSTTSCRPVTNTLITTVTSQGTVITTRVLIVPTLTVMQGEAITLQVNLNEQGDLMDTQTSSTNLTKAQDSSVASTVTITTFASASATAHSPLSKGENDGVVVKPKNSKFTKKDYIPAWKRDTQLLADERGGTVVGRCAVLYGWDINSLDNFVREEIVLATFFMWILGLAILGLLNESIPHFVDVLPVYLNKRIGIQSTVLGLTISTMIASACLCWKIRDDLDWQTFQRIDAFTKVNSIYKLVLALSTMLQLEAFVLVTFSALFLDQVSLADFLYLEETNERSNEGFDENSSMPVPMPQNNLPAFSTAIGPGPATPPRQMFPPMPLCMTATRASSTPS
ncbi:uncharacterized protein I206_106093 [Kwoniella pini CBS 10737]|uniref:Uncharacterized protein n=1 Tax=Kwoniella pini CBS 10737 TaxID=1296096 RepID=A0AAJ8L9S8_9TREE